MMQFRNLHTRYSTGTRLLIMSFVFLVTMPSCPSCLSLPPSLSLARASESASMGGNLSSILLNSGGSAFYGGGTGSSVLEFLYTVGEGESSEDLDVAVVASDVTETTTILLPFEGAIFENTGLTPAVVVSLPKLGVPGSLGVASNIVIDTE